MNTTTFAVKNRQINILEQRLLDSWLIIKEVLIKAKNLYKEDVAYHNYLHALCVANYALNLQKIWFSAIEVRSLIIAWLFHDAGHTWKVDLLDEFLSLDLYRKSMDEIQLNNPDFIVNDSICRHWIIWTVFKNRSKNINKYSKILADFDVWCIWDTIWAFLYYSSLYGYELWVDVEKYYNEVEKGYFKFLIMTCKYILISDEARLILPNSLKNIKKFYEIDLNTKKEIFDTLVNEDITLEEFKKRFNLD